MGVKASWPSGCVLRRPLQGAAVLGLLALLGMPRHASAMPLSPKTSFVHWSFRVNPGVEPSFHFHLTARDVESGSIVRSWRIGPERAVISPDGLRELSVLDDENPDRRVSYHLEVVLPNGTAFSLGSCAAAARPDGRASEPFALAAVGSAPVLPFGGPARWQRSVPRSSHVSPFSATDDVTLAGTFQTVIGGPELLSMFVVRPATWSLPVSTPPPERAARTADVNGSVLSITNLNEEET